MSIGSKFLIGLLSIGLIASFSWPVSGQNLAEICQESNLDAQERQLSRTDYEDLVRQCLAYYEEYYRQKEAEGEQILKETQDRRQTLQSELSSLQSRIGRLEADIRRSSLTVKDLQIRLQHTQESIEVAQRQITDYRSALIEILQLAYEQSRRSPVEIILSGQPLSDIFGDLAVMDNLNMRAEELLQEAIDLEIYLVGQREKMAEEKESIETEIYVQAVQKENLQSTKQEKDVLLTRTRGEEAVYQQQLAEIKEQAQEVVGELKSRLFRMIDSAQEITEYEAVKLALAVADVTGISPSFLLAIIEQESALGRNVGGCYLKDPKDGSGVFIKSGNSAQRVMNPRARSWERNPNTTDFIAITEQLGLDWRQAPVSCWIPAYRSGVPWGWGGAMGPAQFIPSTWLIYSYRVEQTLGVAVADPWQPQHAFLAAALYLRDEGADGTTRGHLNAASRYYGVDIGSAYARSVIDRATKWEQRILSVQQAES